MPVRTAPPDPNPRQPSLVCPPGAVDCHFHLFGPAARYPFAATSKYVSDDALAETCLAMHDRLGIARGVLVSGAGYGTDMTHLLDTLGRFPDRLRGVAYLREDATAADIRRLDRAGVRAVRFVSPAHGGALPGLSHATARLCATFGWHVQYYPHRTELADTADALLALPCDIVLDHFAHIPADGGTGQPAFQRLLELLDSGRVWVKISGPMRCTLQEPGYPAMAPFARALAAHAPERLLWGSDWPHTNMNGRTMSNDGDLLDLLLDWVPDRAIRNRILADNPARLFGFAPARTGAPGP